MFDGCWCVEWLRNIIVFWHRDGSNGQRSRDLSLAAKLGGKRSQVRANRTIILLVKGNCILSLMWIAVVCVCCCECCEVSMTTVLCWTGTHSAAIHFSAKHAVHLTLMCMILSAQSERTYVENRDLTVYRRCLYLFVFVEKCKVRKLSAFLYFATKYFATKRKLMGVNWK